MRTSNILLGLSLVLLYGCQPETPAQQAATPDAAQPAASEAAQVAPVQQAESAPVEEDAQPAVAETPAQADPVPVAAKVKPETSPEPVVSEADAMQLAKKNNCFACHAAGKKVVGPSFKDIAAKYRNDPDAETRMMKIIAMGGSGVWGVMVMPPSPKVGEADRRILAKLVLSSK